MKISELIKLLKKNGCVLRRHGGSHDIWYSPLSDTKFQVPRHGAKEIKTKTAFSILKDAGIRR